MTAPPTMRQLVEGMSLGYDAGAGAPQRAVVELAFTGSERGTYQLVLDGGSCRFEPRPVEVPALRVEADAEAWRAVSEGRLQALGAVLDGRMKVEGDLVLFQRFPRLFRRVGRDDLRAPPGQRAPGPVRLPAMSWLFVALVPWKTFWVVAALRGSRPALLAAMAVALALLASREATGGATFLERATALAFAAAGAAALAGAGVPPGLAGASLLALSAIWAASVAQARHPLTAEYSRWNYAPRLWGTSLFRHPNALLTLLWSAIFAVLGGLATAAGRGWIPGAAATALSLGLCAAGGVYTHRREAGARDRRIDDIDGSLARLGAAARLLLGLLAAAFLLAGDPAGPAGWRLAPAAALAAAALWRAGPAPRAAGRGSAA